MKRHSFECLILGSGEWIRTTDLRVLSKDLESVPHSPSFIRICATGSAKQLPNERWFTLARHTPLVD